MPERNRRTVRDLRRTNRATLLRHLYFHGPLSRQELGTATGLSSASVSNVTAELLADGLLEEAGSVGSDGGRPRTLLRVAPGAGELIGVDVGETRVRVELFDVTLTRRAHAEYPLRDRGHDLAHVVRLVAEGLDTVRAAGAARRPGPPPPLGLLGVGLGVPGIVEDRPERGGAVVHGQTVGWDAAPLEALLRAETRLPSGTPLLISNGARTLGQAETWFGAGRGARDAVVVLLGSGLGAGVITDGSAYGPASRGAGEWGHTTVRLDGRRCRCGAAGCLEAYVGATAVLERWREAGGGPVGGAAGDGGGGGSGGGGEERPESQGSRAGEKGQGGTGAGGVGGVGGSGGEGEKGALAALLAAADGDDPVATAVLDETAACLGAGLADLVNLFSPERIVLSGWAGLLLGPRLLPAVRAAARARALHHPWARTRIALGDLGPDAVTMGAATLPLTRFLDDPPRPTAAPRGGADGDGAVTPRDGDGTEGGPAAGPAAGSAGGPAGGPAGGA